MITESFIPSQEIAINKKYEITENSKEITDAFNKTHRVYQVRAIKDFGNVKKGDLGCWIERELCLEHEGACWADENTVIYGSGGLSGNAVILNSTLYSSFVFGCAFVEDSVLSGASVPDKSVVRNSVLMYSALRGTDGSIVTNSTICDNSLIQGASVIDNSVIKGCTVIDSHVSASTLEGQRISSCSMHECNLTNTFVGITNMDSCIYGAKSPCFADKMLVREDVL